MKIMNGSISMNLGKFETNKIYLGDSYKLIKELPDKSVDLIYTDIPYLIDDGGCSNNDLSRRAQRLRNVDLNDIRKGIDYSIFDEFVRVLRYIYIYIYMVQQKSIVRHYELLCQRKRLLHGGIMLV